MPRLVHVISTPRGVGGAERVLRALVDAGRASSWEQTVLHPFVAPDVDATLRDFLDAPDYRSFPANRPQEMPSLLRWLYRNLRDLRPDLMHVHLFHAAAATAVMPRRWGPRILTHHHGNVLAVQGRRLEARIDRAAGARFDVVVAVSEWVRRFLVEDYGYDRRKVHLIPNGWDGTPYLSRSPATAPTVTCVANLRPEKGVDILLRAFRTIRDEMPHARLVLVGDGKERRRLTALARELHLTEAVEFAGYATDVWTHLADAHVCVVPSRSEALGIAALEAMAAGRPVVASAVGGLPEVVRHDETGFLVPPERPDLLAARIAQVLRDAELRRSMGEAALSRAAGYAAEVMTKSYFDLYDELSHSTESTS